MRGSQRLGRVHVCEIDRHMTVATIIAQHGYGPSEMPRIRYAALREGLEHVRAFAVARNASVHMPRIGTGQAGGAWPVVEELVEETLLDAGLEVMVYDLPAVTSLSPTVIGESAGGTL